MNDSFDTLYGALNRLDEVTDPIYLDEEEEEHFDACLYALDKMAESAMEADALGEAHRHQKLRLEMADARQRGETVEIRRSDALRLSVALRRYRERLRDRGYVVSGAVLERTVNVIDGKLEETSTGTTNER